ncbi:MarR family transcriptional regulator [Acinetobacter gerneri]|uniref:MarR family transcriptional regulator n=1 Tax=Acinetobacter gerneri TaxID=202952 RepID=A0AAW8JJ90_9GAMM|nr:MarR family transcriptional regulator [Acinetobacter gerneri]MDQ9009572.1 MarR family transcriptional regulator [Acinetobacter gerneri]MDQ9013832.1 MarR family transcriptional regulator [Acinetobacter gerneri]MDQ9025000.1 MarR family transcriptional regulator [Acinetobacter gerneri]MDQ9052240.1 MarR family transcriptional regulator [Acinetobacter gerneri]MDQ9059681.1 MarR family transcriptional regulator [Acinetobacter gerneri]
MTYHYTFRSKIQKCSRLMSDELNKILEPYQLNYSLWQVLFVIHSKQRCTSIDIAEYLNVSKPSITKRIQALQKLGALTLLESQDKRQKLLCLSEHGLSLHDHCKDRIAMFEQQIMQILTPSQIQVTEQTMELVMQQLQLMK